MGIDDMQSFPSVADANSFNDPHSDLTSQSPDLVDLGDFTSSFPLFPPTPAPRVPVNLSPESSASSPAHGKRANPSADADVVLKRQRNTIAARKYRQKRLDRIKELEDVLEEMTKERDELRIRLARQEAETATLKEMMRSKSE